MHRFLLAAALLALAPDPAAARDLRPMASDAVRTMTATPRGFGKASPDTIAIYGGPGTPEGKFEDALGQPDWQGWTSVDRTDDGTDKAGDFTKITSGLADLDPCVDNPSPAVNWIDDGSDPNNAPGQSTGGSTSSTWTYTPFVVNYTNGISVLGRPIHNEILSPEIPWELPGTEDDGFGRGAVLEFDVYEHNPLKDGIFYTWRVRSLATGSSVWSDWRDRGFVYFNESPQWKRRQIDITDLIEPDPVKVQIALGIVDLADDLGYPGNDATSGPRFDSMTLKKVNLDGPLVQALQSNIYQDGFPSSGAVFDTLNLISQSIRVDMATNVGTGSQIVPGDSLVVSVAATVPGTSLVRPPQMHWYLETNELFDGVRVLPSGSTLFLPGVWTGTVTGSPVFRETGIPVPNQWYFDLPDGPQRRPGTSDVTELPFFFPGDILTWSVEAVDTDGNTTHFPQEITTNNYSESEECGSSGKFAKPRPPEPKEPIPNEPPSGLPDVWGEAPGFGKNPSLPPGYHQPRILVWDDSDNQDELDAIVSAFNQNGLLYGRDFGVYRTLAAGQGESNGLGGHHGATADQLQYYDTIFYLSGDHDAFLISDGTGLTGNDFGNDLDVLNDWRTQPGTRAVIYFGDNFASGMRSQGPFTTGWLSFETGVFLHDRDASDLLGTLTPEVEPETGQSIFSTRFVVAGGCKERQRFDEIDPRSSTTAIATHRFQTAGGSAGSAAGVWYDRVVVNGGNTTRQIDANFPFSLHSVTAAPGATGTGESVRTEFVAEILDELGHPRFPLDATPNPEVPRPEWAVSYAYPNPFNPDTQIALDSNRRRHVRVKIYDAQGRMVRWLVERTIGTGRTLLEWNGRDGQGRTVASGVYFVHIESEGTTEVRRATLVK